MLDTAALTFRIYIWYEDGELSAIPSEADAIFESALPFRVQLELDYSRARKVPRRDEGRHRVSVPGGSHHAGRGPRIDQARCT